MECEWRAPGGERAGEGKPGIWQRRGSGASTLGVSEGRQERGSSAPTEQTNPGPSRALCRAPQDGWVPSPWRGPGSIKHAWKNRSIDMSGLFLTCRCFPLWHSVEVILVLLIIAVNIS